MKPYATLNVGLDATSEEIDQAYRDFVRRFPPERRPAQFARISEAHDQLKDDGKRLDRLIGIHVERLGNPVADSPAKAVMDFLQSRLLPDLPDEESFHRFLNL